MIKYIKDILAKLGQFTQGRGRTQTPDAQGNEDEFKQVMDKDSSASTTQPTTRKDIPWRELKPEDMTHEGIAAAERASNESMRKMREIHRQMNAAPDPRSILGANAPEDLKWDHPDDLFVEFSVNDAIVVEDVGFLLAYILGGLTEAEKERYPTAFFPCFAEFEDMHWLVAGTPMLAMDEETHCIHVSIGEVVGILMIRNEDVKALTNSAAGIEFGGTSEFVHMQFMRFDIAAVKRFSIATKEPLTSGAVIRVNFAKFKEDEDEEESTEQPTT